MHYFHTFYLYFQGLLTMHVPSNMPTNTRLHFSLISTMSLGELNHIPVQLQICLETSTKFQANGKVINVAYWWVNDNNELRIKQITLQRFYILFLPDLYHIWPPSSLEDRSTTQIQDHTFHHWHTCSAAGNSCRKTLLDILQSHRSKLQPDFHFSLVYVKQIKKWILTTMKIAKSLQ